MEFLKWYLIIGAIVNAICIIYNAKINGYRGNNDIIKNCNIFVKAMAYCGSFVFQVICWVPLITLGILRIITNAGRLNK